AVSERASDAGYPDQKLHAQAHLEALYTSLGFTRTGNLFDEAGIPHVTMVRLTPKKQADKAGQG
ncbi:MAG: GNAT family N-acetyltransferase, partial [Bacteroidota bacterium]